MAGGRRRWKKQLTNSRRAASRRAACFHRTVTNVLEQIPGRKRSRRPPRAPDRAAALGFPFIVDPVDRGSFLSRRHLAGLEADRRRAGAEVRLHRRLPARAPRTSGPAAAALAAGAAF